MRERRVLVVVGLTLSAVVALLLSPAVAAGAAPDAAARTRPVDTAALDSFVSRQVERNHLPGVAVGVVDGDRVVHLSGHGTVDGTHEVTPRTPFVLASASKPLTATAVLQLVSAGRVRLDGRVQSYLPEFEMADARADRITVRQLLEHTSGIPVTSCDTREDATTLAQFVAELRTVRLASAPGEVHSYCSGNYDVLGRLIEVVSGESFGSYVRRHLFAPLGMRHSFTAEAPARAAGLARGHRWLFGFLDAQDERFNTSQLPAGFLVSSAEDMTHFLVAQLDGGRYRGHSVLAPRWVEAMQAPGVPVPGAPGDTYGLGWREADLGGVPTIQHTGDNFSFHTIVFLDPRTRRGAVILVNGNGVLPLTTAFRDLEAGVARIVDGRRPAPESGLTLRQLFVVQDLVLALVLALALWPLVRLPRWVGRLRRDRAAGRRRRLRSGLRIAAEVLLPVAVLVLVRVVLGLLGAQSWSEGLSLFPDTGAWLWTVCLVVLVTGVLRLVLVVRVARRPAPAREDTAQQAGTPVATV